MTLSPTDSRAWRAEAQGRDLAYAAGYRAGLADGHRHRDRLVALGVVAGIVVGGRRLRVHPLILAVLVVALVPVLVVAVAVEMTTRHHRRHRYWPRTVAYGVSWLLGLGLVVLAVASASPWPLVGLALLVLAWTTGPSLVRFARRHRGGQKGPGTGPRPGAGSGTGTGTGSPVEPTWPALRLLDGGADVLPGLSTCHQGRTTVQCRPHPSTLR